VIIYNRTGDLDLGRGGAVCRHGKRKNAQNLLVELRIKLCSQQDSDKAIFLPLQNDYIFFYLHITSH
jgi:hypothetical protein